MKFTQFSRWLDALRGRRPRPRRSAGYAPRKLSLEQFESRQMMSANLGSLDETAAAYYSQAFETASATFALGPVANQATVAGKPVTLTLTSDAPTGQAAYIVVDAVTLLPPVNVQVSINQATGETTLTPLGGFRGTLNLLAGVRDANSADVPENYSTQAFTLDVVAPTLAAIGNQTVAIGLPVTFTMDAATTSGNSLVYKLVDGDTLLPPTNVDVAINQSNGEVTLTPHAGFQGTLNLIASVRDAQSPDEPGNYTSQLFSFRAVGLDAIADQTVSQGSFVSFTLSPNPAVGDVAFTIVAQGSFAPPANVAVSINQATGQVTLTPTAGFTGQVHLRAGVRGAQSPDVEASYAFQDFTLDVTGGITLDAVANQTTTLGVPVTLTLNANGEPAEGVVFKIVAAGAFADPANVSVSINQTTGQVTLTPAAGFVGTINLRAAVRGASAADVEANYTFQEFSLTVGAGPTLNTIANQTTPLGVATTLTLTATGAGSGGAFYAVVDPANSGNVTISINQATGEATLTPKAGFVGTLNLQARVRSANAVDDPANYTTRDFSLTVSAPTLGTVANQTTQIGQPVSFNLTSTDPFGAGVVYSIVDPTTLGAPANVTVNVNASTGAVTLTPAAGFGGVVNLRARVRLAGSPDVAANYVTQDFTLTVNSAVTVNPIDDVEVPEGKTVLVPLSGVDSGGQRLTYTFSSSDQDVQLALVSPNSRSIVLNVTGKDGTGTTFTGQLVLHLFEDLAPATTARIIQLVQQGYYNGLDFFRVVDGFVAQTGNNGSGDTGVLLEDEFNPALTFNSRGLLAMANRGRDTSDAEFFITALSPKNSNNPIGLDDMPEDLNFRYTIFGQLASGMDIFEKLMSTSVVANPNLNNEVSKPVNTITVTSATVVEDNRTAVLRVTIPDGANVDAATITVTATNTTGQSSSTTFDAELVDDTHVDPPYLGAVSNQTTTQNTPITLTLTSTNTSGAGITYTVVDPTTFAAPANVTVSINQQTGQVTLTPAAGFTGTINLLAGVRATSSTDTKTNYDTDAFTLTVSAATGEQPGAPTGLAVDSSSNTGPFAGNGYLTTSTPKLTVNAPTGMTVQFKRGGTVIATATETTAGSGVYTATLPAGSLAVGANSITAVASNTGGTSVDSTALSVIFAPDYAGGVYVVPGAPGASQSITFTWTSKNAGYNNEFGYFIADAATGAVGGVAPGAAGYAQAALNSSTRKIVFAQGQSAGATLDVTLQGGQVVVFYLIQNNTTANFLARNPTNSAHGNSNGGAPLAFFSLVAANPDGQRHTQIVADPTTGRVQYNWEDLLNRGDSDFNDAAILVRPTGTTAQQSTIHAPGTGSTSVKLEGTFSGAGYSGDIGVYFVDDPNGTIGSLSPDDAGYAAAALASANRLVLFAASATGVKSVTVPAGKYLAFYMISSGTTDSFLSSNPTNSASGARALFSFAAANPDNVDHFRWFSPEQQMTDPSLMQLHAMTKLGGGAGDFDAFSISLRFTA